MNYQKIASALLAEVGLTFDDVYELGRPWLIGPPGFAWVNGRPEYAGICHPPSTQNPTARQRHLIGLTGPVDSEWMLSILAHECGHVRGDHGMSSRPPYIEEYAAEIYMIEAFQRHLGRDPHDFLIARAKKYVRFHCRMRELSLGGYPESKGWSGEVLDWCGYQPIYGRERPN